MTGVPLRKVKKICLYEAGDMTLRGRGGGSLTKVLHEEALPKVQTLIFLHTIFGNHFICILYKIVLLSHTYNRNPGLYLVGLLDFFLKVFFYILKWQSLHPFL